MATKEFREAQEAHCEEETAKEQELLRAMAKIVEYMYRDEQKDFEVTGQPENHIFRSVAALAQRVQQFEETGC